MITTPYVEPAMNRLCLPLVLVLFMFSLLSVSYPALADTAKTAANITNTPTGKPLKVNATPVYIEYEGTDTLGANLAFQLRDRFNSSSLFTLTDKDQPKFLLILRTTPEFTSRPAVGSVYAVTWLYYEKKTTYNSYLQQEIGVVAAEDLESVVAQIIEHTTGIAARYGSLLQ